MELNLSALCYPYRRPRHEGSASVLLPRSGGSFMELNLFLSANLCASRGGSGCRPSVIPGLLAGYDAKLVGAGLGRDRVVLEHELISHTRVY
ncbi:hypothetical protein CsSME_00033830 [Camellia sinensis var. sinensis]